ncbi:MAG: hypothetical protein FJ029_16185, partial [Actinobacteria bacterium]|nr:hypothetical protein [Actinomycetota bacterium]
MPIGRVRRRLLHMAWPAMLDNVLQSSIFVVNTAYLGRLGPVELSAAGISNQLLFMGFTLFGGLSVGVLAQVARAVGAGDRDDAVQVGWHGLVLGAALSALTLIVLVGLAAPVLHLAGADDQTVALGAPYLALSAVFGPAQMLVAIFGAILRGAGDTRSPMLASVVMAGVNAVAGYLLVFVY